MGPKHTVRLDCLYVKHQYSKRKKNRGSEKERTKKEMMKSKIWRTRNEGGHIIAMQ